MPRRLTALLLPMLLLLASPPALAQDTDAWIEGYAAALLESERGSPAPSLRVRDGVVSVAAEDLAGTDRARVVEALRAIRGVRSVEVLDVATTPSGPLGTPAAPPVEERFRVGVMPGGTLFTPLISDPRWPHFGASYQYHFKQHRFQDIGELRNVAAVSLGESFSLYRGRLGDGWWEVGVQAGVFSVFDLDAESFDLINSDYLVGVPVSYRRGNLSAMLRVAHESSHLGDELLLREDAPERVGISFEVVDLRVSWEPGPLRVYAGGGYLFDVHPDLERWLVQYGVEFRSPWPPPEAGWRPILGVEVQQREETDWNIDLSLRAGVQFDGILAPRNLQLLLEYYRGHSPNGQFFTEKIESLGIGLHFHF